MIFPVEIVVQVPGHSENVIRHLGCASAEEARSWAEWKARRLRSEGFTVKRTTIEGEAGR